MRAIRRADFADAAARSFDDVGQPEAAADFDEFTARDRHRSAEAEAVQHEQQGGGVVVDDGRRFGAGECAQHRFDHRVAIAAARPAEVVFERDRIDRRFDAGLRHRATDLRAAQVRVDDRAGHVEDVSKAGPNAFVEALFDGVAILLGDRSPRLAESVRARICCCNLAHGLFDQLHAEPVDDVGQRRRGG